MGLISRMVRVQIVRHELGRSLFCLDLLSPPAFVFFRPFPRLWRNWQTRQIQVLVGVKSREGSTPFSRIVRESLRQFTDFFPHVFPLYASFLVPVSNISRRASFETEYATTEARP